MRSLILNIIFLSCLGWSIASQADTNSWQQKAQSVCQQLTIAAQAYQKKDMQQAHVNAVMSYFQNYDVNIEPAARVTFPQGHIFQIEQSFSNLNKNMVDNPSPQQIDAITQQANTLCATIMADAKTMDAQHITSPTYKVN
jgi:hypothetical protein